MSLIKSPADIRTLRTAGRLLAETLSVARENAQPGCTLIELDRLISEAITTRHAQPSFLGYEGFPNASCLSLNDEVVHGIPDARVLKEGDLIGVDVGLWYEHLCVDAAITVPVGKVSAEAEHLLEKTEEALMTAIRTLRPFRRVGTISHTVQTIGEQAHLGIVRSLTGHGVGHKVHEDPEVPNVGRPTDGILLRPGMVLAIEPMFTTGSGAVITDVDGWTVRTRDGSLAAQFEHTVVVTSRGAEIVTK